MSIACSLPKVVGACAIAFLLSPSFAHATSITLTSLIGDKDHGPYPANGNFSEGSPAQIDAGDPTGFDWGYHAGGDTSYHPSTPVDATLNWTHTVNTSGLIVDSVRLDIAVIGFLLGTNYQKLYVGSPLAEIPNAFPIGSGTDGIQTYSFNLAPGLLTSGSLPVQLWVKHDEGWGGVDYAELIVEAHTVDTDVTPVPEPSTLTLLGLGIGAVARRRRRRSSPSGVRFGK